MRPPPERVSSGRPVLSPQEARPLAFPSATSDRAYIRSYPAVAGSVRSVRNALVQFAEDHSVAERTAEAIRLASSEAAANVVEHAYRDGSGQIDVSAELDADAIRIVISDQGAGLQFGNRSPGLGLGFIWMAWFSDGLALAASQAGGLEVTLRFRVG